MSLLILWDFAWLARSLWGIIFVFVRLTILCLSWKLKKTKTKKKIFFKLFLHLPSNQWKMKISVHKRQALTKFYCDRRVCKLVVMYFLQQSFLCLIMPNQVKILLDKIIFKYIQGSFSIYYPPLGYCFNILSTVL